MVKISRAVIDGGRDFILINMNSNIQQIFRMTTFDKVFKIMPEEEFIAKYLPEGSKLGHESKESVTDVNKIELEALDDNGVTVVFDKED